MFSSRKSNSFANTSIESVGRILPRGQSVSVDDGDAEKRRKLMSTFRQASVDETRFTPVEKFEPDDRLESLDEVEMTSKPPFEPRESTKKSKAEADEVEDTVVLLPKLNNNVDVDNDNNNGNGSRNGGGSLSGKKNKASPLRRLAFPLSRAMTLPTQTM